MRDTVCIAEQYRVFYFGKVRLKSLFAKPGTAHLSQPFLKAALPFRIEIVQSLRPYSEIPGKKVGVGIQHGALSLKRVGKVPGEAGCAEMPCHVVKDPGSCLFCFFQSSRAVCSEKPRYLPYKAFRKIGAYGKAAEVQGRHAEIRKILSCPCAALSREEDVGVCLGDGTEALQAAVRACDAGNVCYAERKKPRDLRKISFQVFFVGIKPEEIYSRASALFGRPLPGNFFMQLQKLQYTDDGLVIAEKNVFGEPGRFYEQMRYPEFLRYIVKKPFQGLAQKRSARSLDHREEGISVLREDIVQGAGKLFRGPEYEILVAQVAAGDLGASGKVLTAQELVGHGAPYLKIALQPPKLLRPYHGLPGGVAVVELAAQRTVYKDQTVPDALAGGDGAGDIISSNISQIGLCHVSTCPPALGRQALSICGLLPHRQRIQRLSRAAR